MPLLAIQLTDDARLVAAVAVSQYLPFLVIGLPAGVVLDRFDRRWIAVVAQTLRALVLGVLVLAIVADASSVPVLMGASFLIGASEVMTDGGLPALVRDLVRSEQLEVANAQLIATQRVSNAFLGPPIGAVLFEAEAWLPFAGAAVMSLASVGTLTQIPGRFRPPQAQETTSLLSRAAMGAALCT